MTHISITQADEDTRLDKVLRRYFKFLPQSLIEKSIRKKVILVNDAKTHASYKVQLGDRITHPENFVDFKKLHIVCEKATKLFKSWIIYENEHMCVINKPYGMATQGGTNIHQSVDEIAGHGYHIVHRLDRTTSGLLILAKSPKDANSFMHDFQQGRVQKYYLALVEASHISSGTFTSPIDGKNAKTRYRVIKAIDDTKSLVLVKIYTGRKHQIRIHFSRASMPIVGDERYGSTIKSRLKLHAYKIYLNDRIFRCLPERFFI